MQQETKVQDNGILSEGQSLFTIKEVTDKLKISRYTLYRIIEVKGIVPIKIGTTSVRFTQDQINQMIG